MLKIARILVFYILILCFAFPVNPAALAAAPQCDDALFEAGIYTARLGTPDPAAPFHWRLIDPPYTVDHWRHNGKNLARIIRVNRHNKTLAYAVQYNADPVHWQICRPGNGWKNYLLANAPA